MTCEGQTRQNKPTSLTEKVATGELIWWEGGSKNAGDLPGFLMHNQFSRAKGWHGKRLNVENACKNAKPGPQHLLIKSFPNSRSIHHRGRSNSTLTPATMVFTSFFLLKSGGKNALVFARLVKKDVLHCQSLSYVPCLGLQTKLVEAVHARLTDAQKLCLPSLSTGPFALKFGPTEDNFFRILPQFGLKGHEKGKTMHQMWRKKQNNCKLHKKRLTCRAVHH